MTTPDTPKDGDFASFLEARNRESSAVVPTTAPEPRSGMGPATGEPHQTVQQVLVDGEEPTEAFLEEWNALQNAPELSDEELAQQALNAPGADGDAGTPE